MKQSSFQRPFLKWAGGKFSSLERIIPLLPTRGKRFIEPFAGSAAVFMNTQFRKNLVCDLNADVISVFEWLKEDSEALIEATRTLFTEEYNQKEVYYQVREAFNNAHVGSLERAAYFLYLNRHGYNGLCQYNRSGLFNVAFGRYSRPLFPEVALKAFAKKARIAEFKAVGFEQVLEEAGEGDVVYCDPPYVPLSPTAKFTAYCGQPFGETEHFRLAELARHASKRGAIVVISNHDTPLTQSLYDEAEKLSFQVRRSISCVGQKRAKAPELIALFTPPTP